MVEGTLAVRTANDGAVVHAEAAVAERAIRAIDKDLTILKFCVFKILRMMVRVLDEEVDGKIKKDFFVGRCCLLVAS